MGAKIRASISTRVRRLEKENSIAGSMGRGSTTSCLAPRKWEERQRREVYTKAIEALAGSPGALNGNVQSWRAATIDRVFDETCDVRVKVGFGGEVCDRT